MRSFGPLQDGTYPGGELDGVEPGWGSDLVHGRNSV